MIVLQYWQLEGARVDLFVSSKHTEQDIVLYVYK